MTLLLRAVSLRDPVTDLGPTVRGARNVRDSDGATRTVLPSMVAPLCAGCVNRTSRGAKIRRDCGVCEQVRSNWTWEGK